MSDVRICGCGRGFKESQEYLAHIGDCPSFKHYLDNKAEKAVDEAWEKNGERK